MPETDTLNEFEQALGGLFDEPQDDDEEDE